MGSEEESIEQAVASRRERLLALRAAQELSNATEPESNSNDDQHEQPQPPPTVTDNQEEDDEEEEKPSMKFRNYVPHDKHLQEGKLAPAVLPKFEDPVSVPEPEPETQPKEDPFLNIAPKKPNWDLRRDVQKKLDKLEKRTQKALYQLMVEQEKQNQLAEGDDTNGVKD
ncbi:uncharacterized protein [Cicer arietinum]|uniref:Coiled-coil domain-containing protein 12 n=1 Tax=Cicer arietinum TaxID=3827 RepID=A0A1S2XWA6_CICAR|nr:coiled-coil domain-containing protein 12 [Cicer arietinum]